MFKNTNNPLRIRQKSDLEREKLEKWKEIPRNQRGKKENNFQLEAALYEKGN